MKKNYYLLALIAVMFASCDPLKQTYKDLDAVPAKPGATIQITLTTTYKSSTDANLNIPAVIASRYPAATNSTPALVTFPYVASSSNVAVADSVYSHVYFTLAATDYAFPASTTPGGYSGAANSSPYFTAASAIDYLNYKYPTPAANQLVILNYTFYESGGTAATGTPNTIDSFLYTAGGWIKIYTVSHAQYASVNRGTNDWFLSIPADYSNMVSFFNTFLLVDPAVTTPKTGDVRYISYRMNQTTPTAGNYQKIMTLTFDGSTWVNKQTLPYLKLNGTWVPDPTVYITIPYTSTTATYYTQPDYQYLNTLTNIGNATNRDNVAKYGDFSIQASSTAYWPDADIAAALAAILLHRIQNPVVGVPYKVTYYYYNGATLPGAKIFTFDGTKFNLQ